MRNVLLFIGVLALAACNRDQVKITGHITHAEKMMLHLDEVDVYENRASDSIALKKDGTFSFKFDTEIPCFYQLRLSDDRVIVLFPKPGEHIRVEADANNLMPSLKIEGSHDTEQVTKLIKGLHETKIQLDSITRVFSGATEDSLRERLNKEYQDILERHRKFSITFILTHYNSLASVYALYQQYQPGSYVFYKAQDLQFFKIVSDSLAKYVPGSKHVNALKAYTSNRIGDYKARVILQKADQVESALPDVALPDIKGDTITLKSLKGRHVLLSFWASYSENSVKQNLEFKKIYERYKKRGFEILQVSLDNSVEDWEKAVRFDELPWISVIDSKYPNSIVALSYNVTGVPVNYLIGPDNVSILAKNLTPAQLKMKLDDLFN
ncbi:MAG: AhpC/TSA family protein [Bacteroidales bacterium]|nr:AhpC/TSA family protein [Bacteroidales bacterium]